MLPYNFDPQKAFSGFSLLRRIIEGTGSAEVAELQDVFADEAGSKGFALSLPRSSATATPAPSTTPPAI